MLLRNYGDPADFSDRRSSRDTIDGFALIAASLEGGVDLIQSKSRMADVLAICLGWSILVAVIFYPTLQLAAFCVCMTLMCMRPLIQHAFGFGKGSY